MDMVQGMPGVHIKHACYSTPGRTTLQLQSMGCFTATECAHTRPAQKFPPVIALASSAKLPVCCPSQNCICESQSMSKRGSAPLAVFSATKPSSCQSKYAGGSSVGAPRSALIQPLRSARTSLTILRTRTEKR